MMKFLLLNCESKKILLSAMFLWLSVVSVKAQEITWTWQNPFPTGNSHFDVAWVNEQTIYVSGTKGQFFRSTDFGATWEIANIPTGAAIREIHFIDENIGWAAADNGEIWHTSDGANTWNLQFQDPSGSTLRDIHFYDENTGYAVGDAGFVENVLFQTADGGENWEKADLPIREGAAFYGMFFVQALNADTVLSAGWDNTFFSSYDGGVSWDTTYLPLSSGGFYEGGYFVNDSTGFFVGPDAYILKTIDYGDSWETMAGSADSTDQNTHYFSEVFFLDEKTGWVSSFGCLYKTTDGGDTWGSTCEGTYGTNRKSYIRFNEQNQGIALAGLEIYTTNNGTSFDLVLPVDPVNTWNAIDEAEEELFVAGSGGEIFHTDNQGLDWNIIATPVTSILTDLSFVDNNNGWVVGRDSTVLKTSDGGVTWQALDTDYNSNFNGIYAWNDTEAIVVGNAGAIFKTTNGGADWTQVTITTTNNINAVYFTDTNTGYVAGRSGLMAATTDGGLSWTVQDAGVLSHLNDVFFVDGVTGYAVGNSGQILFTNNGGATWTPQTSGQSSTLNSVFFLDANNGFVTGRGFVLVTEDGGQTWETQDTPSGNSLNDVLFTAPDRGWVVGSSGSVLYFGEDLDAVTGVLSPFEKELPVAKVFPNPVAYQTTFGLPYSFNGKGILQVFQASGQLVYSEELSFVIGQSQWVVHPGLKDGIYPFQLVVDNQVRGGKILIIR